MAIIRCLAISVSHISKDTHDALINRSEFDEMLPYVDNMEDRGLILGVYSDYIEEMIKEIDQFLMTYGSACYLHMKKIVNGYVLSIVEMKLQTCQFTTGNFFVGKNG